MRRFEIRAASELGLRLGASEFWDTARTQCGTMSSTQLSFVINFF